MHAIRSVLRSTDPAGMWNASSITSGQSNRSFSSAGSGRYSPHWTGTPSSVRWSTRRVRAPPWAANRAARLPAGPAPTTTTSKVSMGLGPGHDEVARGALDRGEDRAGVDAEEDHGHHRKADRHGPAVPEPAGGEEGPGGLRVRGVHEHHLQDPGVVEHREGAVQEARDGEPDKPSLRLHRGGEQDELRDEPHREGDPRQGEEQERERHGHLRAPDPEPLPVADQWADPDLGGRGDHEERPDLH